MKKIIVIAGPTAVGKTEYAIEAARAFDGEIVSCDSMQLYKYMDIGSAKPTADQLAAAPHHLVGVVHPGRPFSVAEYRRLAKAAIADIFARGKTPIIAGGTGLYLNSLLYEMDFANVSKDEILRKNLEEEAQSKGPLALHNRLRELDSQAALRIHPNNVKKVIRALEAALSGDNIGDFKNCTQKCKDYDSILIGLTRNRQELYDRINTRVHKLVELGLIQEVRGLLSMGLTEDDISMKGIGYKEIIGCLKGEYDITEAVELTKKNTRHLAKRQITWFKRYEDMHWFNISEYKDDDTAIEELLSWLKNKLESTTKATSPTM